MSASTRSSPPSPSFQPLTGNNNPPKKNNTMKHKYTDEQLQAAIDLAVAQYRLNTVCTLPTSWPDKWVGEMRDRLDLIKSALATLPEPMDEESMLLNLLAVIHRDGGHYQAEHGTRKAVEDACKEWQRLILLVEKAGLTEPPTVDGKTPGQVACEAWNNGLKWKETNYKQEWERSASAVLAAFGNQSQPTEIPWTEWHGGECPLKDEEVDEWEIKFRDGGIDPHPNSPQKTRWHYIDTAGDIIAYRVLKWKAECGLSQLRPLSEAGEVPEGCVRYYTYKKDGEWTTKSKYRAMQDTHFVDVQLPAAKADEPVKAETFEAHGNTWTKHKPGDAMPCDGSSAVMALLGDGTFCTQQAEDWNWNNRDSTFDIVGWRYADKPLVTKSISPPTWTPAVGDVVTLKSGGAKMTVMQDMGPKFLCAYDFHGEVKTVPISTNCLQSA